MLDDPFLWLPRARARVCENESLLLRLAFDIILYSFQVCSFVVLPVLLLIPSLISLWLSACEYMYNFLIIYCCPSNLLEFKRVQSVSQHPEQRLADDGDSIRSWSANE